MRHSAYPKQLDSVITCNIMSKFIRIVGDNPNYVPDGIYTGIFNQIWSYTSINKTTGHPQQVVAMEFAVPVPGVAELRRVKKHYYLPNNRIDADLRRYFGEDYPSIMKGRDLDINAANKLQGMCADVEVTNFQGKGYPFPYSKVESYHPCGTLTGPQEEEDIIIDE